MREARRPISVHGAIGYAHCCRLLEEPKDDMGVPEVVQQDVEFTSIAAHGRMGAPAILVRAEITVDGGPPPDGRSARAE